MNIEEETFKLYKRMKRMFDIENNNDAGGCKGSEPRVSISYEITNQDYHDSEPIWYCGIFSYLVEIKDEEGFGKRRYQYWGNSLEEVVEKVTLALDEAETQYDLEKGTIIKRFGDEDDE